MLSEGYIQSLAQSMMIKQYLPGELIILKGTIGTEFYFIDRGSVDVIADTQPCTPGLKDSVSLSLASDACNKSSSPMPLGESTSGKTIPVNSGPIVTFGGEENHDPNVNGNKSTSGDKREYDISKPIEGKASPLQGIRMIELIGDEWLGEENAGKSEGSILTSSPLHNKKGADAAAVINAGVNHLLHNYENARIKNIGGVVRKLEEEVVSTGKLRGEQGHRPNSARASVQMKTKSKRLYALGNFSVRWL